MPSPYDKVSSLPESVPLLETDVALAASTAFPATTAGLLTYIDVVDILPRFGQDTGFAGGTAYTRDPDLADPRYVIDWFIYARSASLSAALGSGHTPGILCFYGGSLDVATGGVNIPVGGHMLAAIPYNGHPRFVAGLHPTAATVPYVRGQLRASSRMLAVQYQNLSVEQTVFHLGVYLRPW